MYHMQTKTFTLTEKAAPTVENSAGSWVISSSDYDRVNDRIMPDALKSVGGNDILCLWQHDTNQPVGKWTNIRMKGSKLVADLVLAPTNLGKMISALLSVSTPLGASIGFSGKGKANTKGGIDFSEISILETSVVSVPCNAQAMRIAKSFNMQEFIDTLSDGGDDVAASGFNLEETLQKSRAAILAANQTIRKVRP
jgi:HK97 family phage prohead protease